MKTKLIREAGYKEAMLGLSLSYGTTIKRAEEVAKRLAKKQGGHNKFLESIMLWIDCTAPRYFWQQADTYRMSTKQSESTMHTIMKRDLTMNDFECGIWEPLLNQLNHYRECKSFVAIKHHLPESFLQRRIWCMSYKTFQNIYNQRKNHRLQAWRDFIDNVLKDLQHREFIT